MKQVYSAESIVQVTHVRNLLEAQGIHCELRNERLSGVIGDIPFLETWPELWVDELDFDRAQELIEQEVHGPGLDEPSWKCPSCGEVVEGQFSECWNCGTGKPRSA